MCAQCMAANNSRQTLLGTTKVDWWMNRLMEQSKHCGWCSSHHSLHSPLPPPTAELNEYQRQRLSFNDKLEPGWFRRLAGRRRNTNVSTNPAGDNLNILLIRSNAQFRPWHPPTLTIRWNLSLSNNNINTTTSPTPVARLNWRDKHEDSVKTTSQRALPNLYLDRNTTYKWVS